ncbi:monosaccharide-transporting ATPase [Deinococcus roseus]|uniref:Autoinducer 2 import system permease protein LsrD n=1 Tax=Deinococcus roseus TaxID=392414 RepID=A0ABQ2D234_9DEIO|nr:monosaccharide-transporting ATPase [Deinococcus roseus]
MKGDLVKPLPAQGNNKAGNFFRKWEVFLTVFLIAVMLLNSRLTEYFWDPFNLGDATANFAEKGIMALAMALLILVREIDLSVASIIALSSLVMGLLAKQGLDTPVLIVAGILTGALCGLLNGFLVVRFAIPSIAITLGTMSLFRGISQAILGDTALTEYPESFAALGQSYWFTYLPISFVVFLVLAVLVGGVLHLTRLGRNLYAMGNNPEAARFSGIQVLKNKLVLFLLSGTFAGLAAVFLTARISSTRPNIGQGWELDVITMVVLGGVSIAGGTGSISGVVLAVLLLGMISFGMGLLNIPGIVGSIVVGSLLILAIALPNILQKLSRKKK